MVWRATSAWGMTRTLKNYFSSLLTFSAFVSTQLISLTFSYDPLNLSRFCCRRIFSGTLKKLDDVTWRWLIAFLLWNTQPTPFTGKRKLISVCPILFFEMERLGMERKWRNRGRKTKNPEEVGSSMKNVGSDEKFKGFFLLMKSHQSWKEKWRTWKYLNFFQHIQAFVIL